MERYTVSDVTNIVLLYISIIHTATLTWSAKDGVYQHHTVSVNDNREISNKNNYVIAEKSIESNYKKYRARLT